MIIRGTDSDIKITFKTVDPATITTAYLTIDQGDETVLEKDLSEATVGDGCLIWTLSQAETLSLSVSEDVSIQCRYKVNGTKAGATKHFRTYVYSIQKDGEI